MSWYEDNILPRLIDLSCAVKPAQKQREKIVPLAEGDVLEIGFGSGLNLAFYDPKKVRRVWGLEPSAGMRKLAAKKIGELGRDVELLDSRAEEVPLPSKSVDTVLVTYTLCTIPDAVLALDGMRRVLKPSGRLLYCEHGAAPDAAVRRWQDRLNSPWGRIAGGCNINRDIAALIRAGGFDIVSDERMYIPGLRIFSYNYWGSAVPA